MPRKKTKKTPLLRLPHPNNRLLFAIGLLFLSLTLAYRIHLLVRLSFNQPLPPLPADLTASLPSRVIIEKVNIDLVIYPTSIQKNTWQISEKGASYLYTSSRPGTEGPIILYSHNTTERFGPIRWLDKGDQIKLETADGVTHEYEIAEILTVKPDNIEALLSNTETLVLYTCTGFLDRDRFIVRATPIN